jgi:tetratricopeptide (TPR) repeat protein
MKKYAALIQEAISAAKNQNWDQAIELNTEILERNAEDIGAINRMGLAYLQLGKTTNARKAFKSVLEKDKSNIIAKKHLNNLKNKQTANLSVSQVYFIEEPGKTKIADLHRLARKDFLSKLSVGQKCQLVSKGKHISVETEEGKYVGSLPDDLSFRLCKLISGGNEYKCLVHSFNGTKCRVHLREDKTSAKNKNVLSFPSGKIVVPKNSPMEEELLIENDIPVDTAENKSSTKKTSDFETTLEKINKGEEI